MMVKKIASFILLAVLLTGCSLPFTVTWNTPQPTLPPTVETSGVPTEAPVVTEAPAAEIATSAPSPTEAPLNGTEINQGGVYMVLPPCLAVDATGSIIQAIPYDEMAGPQEYFPAHRKITFQDYPLSGNFYDPSDLEKGGLAVYPVAEFVAMNPIVGDRVNKMQTMLLSQSIVEDAIPLLPVVNAAQVFKAQAKFLSFQNGQGVRYLTEYAQFSDPVNNEDLFYSFQGLTADGKYWVSALLPVNAAYLQASFDSGQVPADGIAAPDMMDADFNAKWGSYIGAMIDKLNGTPDNAFTPGLDCLDQYIQSLFIGD